MSTAPKKTRFYRELLTPQLHRRFTSAASWVLCACYAETLLIRSWSSKFWWFFPIGFAGIQTLLFFIPAFAIFILRVSQVHFGLRTSPTPAHTAKQLLLRPSTWSTIFTYVSFGFLYGEVYMWTAPASADLAWVKEGRTFERLHLNERPIFLRSNFFLLSLTQAAYHLWWDLSRIRLPRVEPDADTKIPVVLPAQRVREAIGTMLALSAGRTAVATFCNLFIYALFLRPSAYRWSRDIGRIIWNISRNAEPGFVPPYHWTLLVRSVVSGTLMIFLWEFSNRVFNIYVAQEPVKKDKPLTEDSPDPNGSLLNGLQSKKELVRTFAFWELHTISSTFPARRKAIFADLDRSGGSAWTQILNCCLDVIAQIDNRISNRAIPPPEMTLDKARTTPERLPRLLAPLEQGMILSPRSKPASRAASYEAQAGALARTLGSISSPSSTSNSPSTALLRSSLSHTKDALLTQEQQAQLTPEALSDSALSLVQSALRTPLGFPFRQTFAARARAKALGTPYSDLDLACYAIGSVARLAAASVQEDQFGTVHRDVAAILRALARVTASVEAFVRESPVHWTDVGMERGGSGNAGATTARTVPEIETLLTHLRCALTFLIHTFEGFAKDMGLGETELREARKAAGMAA